jgi:hypothetical protein
VNVVCVAELELQMGVPRTVRPVELYGIPSKKFEWSL